MFFLVAQYLGLLIFFLRIFMIKNTFLILKQKIGTSSQEENVVFYHKSVWRLHFGGIF